MEEIIVRVDADCPTCGALMDFEELGEADTLFGKGKIKKVQCVRPECKSFLILIYGQKD